MVKHEDLSLRGAFRGGRMGSAVALLALVATACGPSASAQEGLPPAPDFTAQVLGAEEGTVARLSDFHGSPMVLNFWASWCAPCRLEVPDLQEVADEFADRGLVVLGVDVHDSQSDALAFLKEWGITYRSVVDKGEITRLYDAFPLPITFFITKERTLFRTWQGPIRKPQIVEIVEEML